MSFLKQWPFWVMAGLFLMTIALAVYDPLNFNPDGVDSTNIAVIWYFLPAIIIWGIVFVRPTISKSELAANENDVLKEKVNSTLRHIITSLTAIIALSAAFQLKIPFIQPIFDFITWVSGMSNNLVDSVMTIVSFATIVYGFFKQGMRFEINAKAKELTKGRKYPY